MTDIEIVRAVYAAMAAGDITGLFELVDEACVITQDSRLPWGGRYVGHDGLATFGLRLRAAIQSTVTTDAVFVADGDVIQVGRTAGTTVVTGTPFDVAEVHRWTIRDGRAVAAHFSIDTPAMLDALGFARITRHEDADPAEVSWVGEPPVPEPIDIVEPDPSWPARFDDLAARIREALGERVLALEHVGSTSVPGLPAKPVIDIDVTVADSSDEPAYMPALEQIGFVLRIREPRWHEHRCLVATSPPRANLHVWSPDSPETIRHRMFRDWLRAHPDDRDRYAHAKRASAAESNAAGEAVIDYNLRKQPVIREILDRIFEAQGMR